MAEPIEILGGNKAHHVDACTWPFDNTGDDAVCVEAGQTVKRGLLWGTAPTTILVGDCIGIPLPCGDARGERHYIEEALAADVCQGTLWTNPETGQEILVLEDAVAGSRCVKGICPTAVPAAPVAP